MIVPVAGFVVGGAELGKQIDSVPAAFLLELEVPAWKPKECRPCAKGETIVAPGSRFLAHKS